MDEHRLITYLSNPVERLFVAPLNMNYHAVHHLYPSIPYYHLAVADREVRLLPAAAGLEWAALPGIPPGLRPEGLPLTECAGTARLDRITPELGSGPDTDLFRGLFALKGSLMATASPIDAGANQNAPTTTLTVPRTTGRKPRRRRIGVRAPLIETEDVPLCPVCGGQVRPVHRGLRLQIRTCRNPWRFVQCRDCRHVWLNPRPALATLPVIYPPTYYSYNYKQIHPLALWAKERLDRRKMRAILRRLPAPPKTFLDVGCGDGRFLPSWKNRESSVELPACNWTNGSSAPWRKPVIRRSKRVGNCGHVPENHIDLATMFHVIEHVDDPGQVIRKVGSCIAPGGLAIETPNLESLDLRLFQQRHWGGYHIPRRWNLSRRPRWRDCSRITVWK